MQLSKDVVIVTGDSWAAGEVDSSINLTDQHIVYGGMTEFICNLGYEVRNLAVPGASNLQSCDRLLNYMRYNQPDISRTRCIIFWTTEFFREIWYYKYPQLVDELTNGYVTLKDQWVYRPYYRLSEISQHWNIPIYVIGGASDAVWYDGFEKDFPGVKVACQSVTNYLIHGNHRIATPVFCEFLNKWTDEFLDLVKSNISNNDLEILIADMSLGHQRVQLFENRKESMFPDGLHPGREAQRKLFDFLLTTVPELTIHKKASHQSSANLDV